MEFLMIRRADSIFILCLLLLISGCARRFRLTPEQLARDSAWPFFRADLQGTGSVEDAGFEGRLDLLWERSFGEKPAGPLTVSHGVLICPGSKRKIRFYETATGDYLGHFRPKRAAQTGLALLDSLAYFGTTLPSERVDCVNFINRDRVWHQDLKDAAPGTIIVDNRLIVASSVGLLWAYDAFTGRPLWSHKVDDRLVAGPVSDGRRIYQPVAGGVLLALAPEDGRVLFQIDLKTPLTSSVAVSDLIYVAGFSGDVFALDPVDGRIVWRSRLDGNIWTAPAIADGRVFVGLSSGTLVALDAGEGNELWRYRTDEVIKAAPVAIGEFVVFGTMGGKLFSLYAADGKLADRRQLRGAIAAAPVTDGQRIFVATERGEIACFGKTDDQIKSGDERADPENRPERTGSHSGTGTGHGSPQSVDLRHTTSDGDKGDGETVPDSGTGVPR